MFFVNVCIIHIFFTSNLQSIILHVHKCSVLHYDLWLWVRDIKQSATSCWNLSTEWLNHKITVSWPRKHHDVPYVCMFDTFITLSLYCIVNTTQWACNLGCWESCKVCMVNGEMIKVDCYCCKMHTKLQH